MKVECGNYSEGNCIGGESAEGCKKCCIGCTKSYNKECSVFCMGAINESVKNIE